MSSSSRSVGVREDASDLAFSFVRALADELASGSIELPGFPHAVAGIQRVLNDDRADTARIVRAVGGEPVIAGQLIRMANSVVINASGTAVQDLRSAVARLGVDAVRTATIAFAVRQLRQAPALRGLEQRLGALWKRSVQIASLSYTVGVRLTRVNPDTAMLAGLVQGVGKLYILSHASQYPGLFADPDIYQRIEQEWHLNIASALLENWDMADEIVEAVYESENLERVAAGEEVGLADVLVAATLLAQFGAASEDLLARVRCAKPLHRLRLDFAACEAFISDSAHEIAALEDALSD